MTLSLKDFSLSFAPLFPQAVTGAEGKHSGPKYSFCYSNLTILYFYIESDCC